MQPTTILRSYGRTQGRKLKPAKAALVETMLGNLLIDEQDFTLPTLFDNNNPIWFEIGFGAGEHIAYQAAQHRNINFIGCEPYLNGVADLLGKVQKQEITNLRLYENDARILLEKLPDHALERIFLLFPDPWRKKRHYKRRIISQATLALFHSKLTKGGLLRIATDHYDYCAWILEQLFLFPAFEWQANTAKDFEQPPQDWVKTRYQQKAEAENRKPSFLDYVKL